MVIKYKLIKESKECLGRVGEITTPHGTFETPVFMAVGTQATVKTLTKEELKTLGSKIILKYLSPLESTEVILSVKLVVYISL